MAPDVAGVRRVGADALLLEVGSADAVAAVAAHVRARALADGWHATEVVPGARTVLIDGLQGVDPARLEDEFRGAQAPELAAQEGRAVELPVIFDGEDVEEVAALWGVHPTTVVERLVETELRVAFCGFAPGFGYLAGLPPELAVPRRSTPRTRVPSGAVGLAGTYAGVYPRSSPGGWQLVGRLAEGAPALWDVTREAPALLAPGTRVRFVSARGLPRVTRALDSDVLRAPLPAHAEDQGRELASSASGERSHPAAPGERVEAAVRIERAGVLATIQDLGRPGLAHLGVPRSGAADVEAHLRANAAVGNELSAATIEATASGCAMRALRDLVVAVDGARCPVWVGGVPAPFGSPVRLRAGQVIEMGAPEAGLRSYLAIRGGVAVEPVLGSRATDVLSGLGPEPLSDGDELAIGPSFPVDDAAFAQLREDARDTAESARMQGAAGGATGESREPPVATLAVIPGPRADMFVPEVLEVLAASTYTVTGDSNRVGLRLEGAALERTDSGELESEGLVQGAVQVPPSGQPVVFLADHPTTGGYPVVGVIDADSIDRAAQLRPGDGVRFRVLLRPESS